jgi:hypothetical protein
MAGMAGTDKADASATDADVADASDPCDACIAGATCQSSAGTCTCPAGYAGDGTKDGTGCDDVDECAGSNDCVSATAGGTCTNTIGSHACACAGGYSGDGTTTGTGCTDLDECLAAADNTCVDASAGGTCVNAGGTFTCACAAGYAGDGIEGGTGCTDVVECSDPALNDCVDAAGNGTCTNSVGSFSCSCAPGYTGDGREGGTGCSDVVECSDPALNDCVDSASGGTCSNNAGSFACGCATGYTGDGREGGTGCSDVVECSDPALNDCVGTIGGTCANTIGSFDCGCTVGYTGDGREGGTGCTDVVECSDPLLNDCVDVALGGTCSNSVGSYACACATGYTGDGTEGGTGCTDVDECTLQTDDCGVDSCVNATGSFACHALLAASPFQDFLVRLDIATGAGVSRVPFGSGLGGAITGVNGLATHPTSGEIYGIAKVTAVSGRVLFRMDPSTLALTSVGNLGDNFSSLTFADDGTLYGVTGDGATAPETLYTISTTDAAKTLAVALGAGADGEVIAWNPEDDLIYHWSGNGTVVMESIDPANAFAVTNIPISGDTTGEIFGAVYNPFTQDMLVTDISSRLDHVTAAGAFTRIGANTYDDMRGPTFTTRALRQTISPAAGPVAGGNIVTLRSWSIGVNGTATVNFGASPGTAVTRVDDNTITVVAPAGTGPVTIAVNNGTNVDAIFSYTYEP